MASTEPGRTVVVPVANPASTGSLFACAARIAGPDAGRVELLTVLRPGSTHAEQERAHQLLSDAAAATEEPGVRAACHVVLADDPASGVLASVDEFDASLVLMGWRGASSNSDVFGHLIDSVVGRSTVPLAIVRTGVVPHRRVVLPVSADHLLPGGAGSLGLAARLAERLRFATTQPTVLLRTGPRAVELPAELRALGDRIHHDPRRTDQAVAAFARDEDLVVAAVAPTVSGLRAATTHLAWAAPRATLLVAVDVGPTRETGLAGAVQQAGEPAPPAGGNPTRLRRVVVTARLPDDRAVTPDHLDRVLRRAGATEQLMAWWASGDPRPHVRATVSVQAGGVNAAIGQVMIAVDEAPELSGAEISYDVERDRRPSRRSSAGMHVDEGGVPEDRPRPQG